MLASTTVPRLLMLGVGGDRSHASPVAHSTSVEGSGTTARVAVMRDPVVMLSIVTLLFARWSPHFSR